jgi:MFS family permease
MPEAAEVVLRAKRSVATGFFLAGVTVGTLAPRLAEVKINTSASDSSYGTAFAINSIGALVGFLVGAKAAQSVGTKKIASIIFYLMLIANFSFSLATNAVMLALVAISSGVVYSMFNVNMNSQGVLVEQRLGRSFMPRAHAAWSLGSLVAGLASAAVAPYLSVMMTLAIADIFCAIVWLFMSRGLMPHQYDDQPKNDSSQLPHSKRIPSTTFLFLLVLALGQSISMLAEGAVGDWSSVLLHEDLGIAIGPNGYAFVAFSVMHLLTRYFMPRFIDRSGLHRVVRIVASIGVTGFIAFHLLALSLRDQNLNWVLICSCIAYAFLAFGLGVMVPAFATAAGGIIGLPSARALMVLGVAGALILWIGRTLLSFLAENYSLPFAITFFAVLAYGSVYLAKFLDPKYGEEKRIKD